MLKLIESVREMFKAPSPEALALKELEESRRKLLETLSAREWADSSTKYYETKIKRLSAYLHNSTGDRNA